MDQTFARKKWKRTNPCATAQPRAMANSAASPRNGQVTTTAILEIQARMRKTTKKASRN